MPSARKLLKLSGAAVVGTAVAAVFAAAPAFAWSAEVKPKPVCADNGTVTVTWKLHNNERHAPATFGVTDHTPASAQISTSQGNTIPANGTVEIVESGVPSGSPATIAIHVVWSDKDGNILDQRDVNGEFGGKTCEQPPPPSPSASASPSPSTGGNGGGEGTPTPSTTPAPPSLPVTGPNTAIYGGGAAALLVAGGALFLVARRRRIRFEA
jgi:LPXTG-motif cell wall-anchored protein